MTDTQLLNQSAEALAQLWKGRYQRQELLIGSITSLLDKYGSSLDLDHLYQAFLLTLMGHYVIVDACYYAHDADDMVPRRAYGRIAVTDLPRVPAAGHLCTSLLGLTGPVTMNAVDESAKTELPILSNHFSVIAPLRLEERLLGAVLLGPKVDGSAYTEFDLHVLHALCAASAMTFNNAILCRNARLASEEIRKVYLVRSELVSRISHEFRTPLTVIKAAVELLAKAKVNAGLCESLAASAVRLEALTEDLLRLKEECVDESLESLTGSDAARVVEEVTARCSTAAQAKGIRLVFRRESAVDRCTIGANQRALMDAVEALVDNAIKYSPPSTTVEVSVGTTSTPNPLVDGSRLSDWKGHADKLMGAYGSSVAAPPLVAARGSHEGASGGYLVVRVSDSGIGIPEKDIDLLGEPFRQASNSPEVGVKGQGLGLARAYQAVTRWNGEIFCRSAEGVGTTFSVFLPFAVGAASRGAH